MTFRDNDANPAILERIDTTCRTCRRHHAEGGRRHPDDVSWRRAPRGADRAGFWGSGLRRPRVTGSRLGPTPRTAPGSRGPRSLRRALGGCLAEDLPRRFLGYSTSFGLDEDGVGVLIDVAPGERVAHRVEILEVAEWCEVMLGFDLRSGVCWLDGMATSNDRLAEVTGGEVIHDGLGDLGASGRRSRTTRAKSGSTCARPSGSASRRRRSGPPSTSSKCQ